ncbi:hypothetical protein HY087_01930 [Candidatus Gottesmanbacteria bacterium]|nr:hypothetical protein [Candidatus Gottesmanbacteria bacterium]
MAKRTSVSKKAFIREDLSSWNFIIFLTLAFVLLVVVLTAMKKVSLDLRSRAGLACPQLELPRAEDCSGGWTYKRDGNGCLAFFCEAKNSQTSTKAPVKK